MTVKITKTKTLLLARLLPLFFIALAVPARAVVSPFIRAGVDFSKLNAIESLRSDETGWKDKLDGWDAGYFAEVGLKLLGSHSLGVEAGYVKAKDSAAGLEKEQIPLLLNYRCLFGLGPVSLFIGASAGMMSDRMGWREDVNSITHDLKDTNWVALYGATAGLGLKLGKHWGVDVGVRALAVNEKEYQDGGLPGAENYKIGKSEVYIRPNVRVAISCHW
ncbi:outer membrane beta-barrel protein [Termitidicoccus mucosus]|uniref:Outer membrane protein beta-barrel domain-containing protein n=1 Tax=Termitidicoccus mucosus TaxID=1184151 RepID=A0A178ILJ7_9BACT|nr:hypothetical protein AW736_00410 [Opitutaceae bacterium TSB47]